MIRNMRSVVNEQVYTWTERVGKVRKERLLATIRDPRSLSILARVAGVKEIVDHLSLSLPGDAQKVRHVRDLDPHRGRLQRAGRRDCADALRCRLGPEGRASRRSTGVSSLRT
jgi:hypothetical protein